MENTPMICADQVRFRYDDQKDVWAVNGAGMTVKKGEFVVVLGANGCGKSTLAKHFNAILLPESGTVTVEGIPTTDEARLYDIRQRVGMVFQNPDNQIVATVVDEHHRPPEPGFRHYSGGHHPLYGRGGASRPGACDERGPRGDGGHAPTGV